MKKVLALAIAGLVLGGCVTAKMEEPKPGQYANYRDMMYSKMRSLHWKDVPPQLETKMVTCTVDIMVDSLTPSETARLDAYARGEITMPDSERSALEQRMRGRLDDATFNREMQKTCPGTAAELADFRAKNG